MIEHPTDRKIEEKLGDILQAMEEEFHGGPDRVIAIVGAAYLDEMLAELFRAVCIPSQKDIDGLLRPDGVLGSNGARLNIAHGLGLINERLFSDLKTIARIRNQFAHGFASLSFDDDRIRDLCRNLKQPEIHAAQAYSIYPKDEAAEIESALLDEYKVPKERYRVSVIHLLSGLARRIKYARKGSHQLWFTFDPDSTKSPDVSAANS